MNEKIYVNFIKIIVGAVLIFAALFPIILLIGSSFKLDTEVFDYRLIPKQFTLDAYKQAFGTVNLFGGIKNSMFVATMVSVLALLIHSMAGFAFARLNFPGKKGIFLWMLSTMMVPLSVILIPLFFIIKQIGLINSLWGMILPMVPHAYGVFLFRQFFYEIPSSLYESAKIDGCSIFAIFRKIFIPLARPIYITLGISFFVTSWNNYLWPTIVAQETKMYTVQILIASLMGTLRISWNMIMASSVIAVLPTIILFAFLQRYYIEGIKTTGIKD